MKHTILYIALIFGINTLLSMENNNDEMLQMKSDKSIWKKFSNVSNLMINNPIGFVARTSVGGGVGYGASQLVLHNIPEDSTSKLLKYIKNNWKTTTVVTTSACTLAGLGNAISHYSKEEGKKEGKRETLENLIKSYEDDIQDLRNNLEINYMVREIKIELIEKLIEKIQIELNQL